MTRDDLEREARAALTRLRAQYPDNPVSDEVWLQSIREHLRGC